MPKEGAKCVLEPIHQWQQLQDYSPEGHLLEITELLQDALVDIGMNFVKCQSLANRIFGATGDTRLNMLSLKPFPHNHII